MKETNNYLQTTERRLFQTIQICRTSAINAFKLTLSKRKDNFLSNTFLSILLSLNISILDSHKPFINNLKYFLPYINEVNGYNLFDLSKANARRLL